MLPQLTASYLSLVLIINSTSVITLLAAIYNAYKSMFGSKSRPTPTPYVDKYSCYVLTNENIKQNSSASPPQNAFLNIWNIDFLDFLTQKEVEKFDTLTWRKTSRAFHHFTWCIKTCCIKRLLLVHNINVNRERHRTTPSTNRSNKIGQVGPFKTSLSVSGYTANILNN